jgi:hypothetical protein
MNADMDYLDLIIDECIDRLQRGESLEACLTNYPDQAETLRPVLAAAEQLAAFDIPASSQMAVDAGRQRMLAALDAKPAVVPRVNWIKPVSFVGIIRYLEQVQITIQNNLTKEYLVMHKTVIAIVLVLAIFFGGTAVSAYAAQSALPGDALYSMKTAIEDASADLAMDSARIVRVYLRLAEKRIDEIETLATQGRYQDMEMAVTRFQSHVDKAIESLLVVAQGNPSEAKVLAESLGNLMDRHSQVLLTLMATAPDDVQSLFEDAVDASQDGASAASQFSDQDGIANDNNGSDDGAFNANEDQTDNSNLNTNEGASEDQNVNGDDSSDDDGLNTNGDDSSDDEGLNTNGDDSSDDEDSNTNSDDSSDDLDENINGDDSSDDEDENINGDDSSDDEDGNTNGDDSSDDEDGNTNGDESSAEDDNANGDDNANDNSGEEEDSSVNDNGDDSSSDTNDNSSDDDSSDDGSSNENDSGDDDSGDNGDDSSDDNSDDATENFNDNTEDVENTNS